MAGNRALIYESIIRDMSEGIMTIDLNGTIIVNVKIDFT